MEGISRAQLILYVAAGIAVLLVGARWVSSGSGTGNASAQGVEFTDSGGGGGVQAGVSAAPGGEDVVVDVTGAVRDSGVYRMPAGSRVDDAIKRAGGASAAAQLDSINLAARLTDGQQVAVPARVAAGAASGAPAAGTASGAADPAADAPISLSSATAEDLDTIEGIGPVTAQDIIDFRDQHGGVGSIDDLDQISGIGPATMEALRARLQP